MKKIEISWEETGKMIDKIISQVAESGIKFENVYGVPRGGLILAVALSNNFNIPLTDKPTESSLVAEDISDNGNTLKDIKCKKIACLYKSLWTKTIPDFYAELKTDKESWIVFPWEDKE